MSRYDDIIDHPHHVSENHPQMSMHDRAAQFSAFAALVGYEDAVDETARLTEQRRELDEQELAELNRRLSFLGTKLAEHPEISVRYFVADKRKAGGKYETVSGKVAQISAVKQTMLLQDGQRIRIADIQWIDGELFESME